MPTNVDQYFKYDHLSAKLQEVSRPIAEAAEIETDARPMAQVATARRPEL